MKRRFSSHTTLIELTMALLFFMLASVTILSLFTTAYTKSQTARQSTHALRLARDCAAVFAAGREMGSLGYVEAENGTLVLNTDADLRVVTAMESEQTEVGELQTMTISVQSGDKTLVEMPVSRYYNKEVIHP